MRIVLTYPKPCFRKYLSARFWSTGTLNRHYDDLFERQVDNPTANVMKSAIALFINRYTHICVPFNIGRWTINDYSQRVLACGRPESSDGHLKVLFNSWNSTEWLTPVTLWAGVAIVTASLAALAITFAAHALILASAVCSAGRSRPCLGTPCVWICLVFHFLIQRDTQLPEQCESCVFQLCIFFFESSMLQMHSSLTRHCTP